jgi:hypothetical protein
MVSAHPEGMCGVRQAGSPFTVKSLSDGMLSR